MLSRYLYLPIGLTAAILAALAFNLDNGNYAIGAVALGILMIGLYFFSDVIDWWWHQDHAPKMDDRMKELLQERLPFYQKLSTQDKTKFETRVEYYVMGNEFIPNGWKKIPYDIQAWVAVNPIMLTFHQEDYLLNKFERVVIYPHSFPSPKYPEQIHSSEVFEEDGVVLFSSEKLLPGVMQPRLYFNIGLYEYAKVYQLMYPNNDYPSMSKIDWLAFEQIVNYTQKKLEVYIGLNNLNEWGVLAALFFSHPEEMREKLPEHYEKVREILDYPEHAITLLAAPEYRQ